MNLNAIRKVCLRAQKFLVLNDQHHRQWLSDGYSAYPVDGIHITESAIPALFWLDEKQTKKQHIAEVDIYFDPRFSLEQVQGERYVKDVGAIWCDGALYRAVMGSGGLMFLDVDELKPAENKEGYMLFAERENAQGEILIAAYGNMFVSAIVKPVIDEKAQRIMEIVTEIARLPVRLTGETQTQTGAEAQQIGLETVETIEHENGVVTEVMRALYEERTDKE